MEELKIVGWTSFEDIYPSRNVEGDEFQVIVQLIGEEIIKHGYCFSGEDHQNSFTGVPVFNDGTCLRASMRTWGLIMSVIYSALDEKEYSYMDFYMSTPKETVLPDMEMFDVKPSKEEQTRPGVIIQGDIELLSSSLNMDMELMTTDKIVKQYYELLKKERK